MKRTAITLFAIGVSLIVIARLTYPIFSMDWFVIAYGTISAVCISLGILIWRSDKQKKGGKL